MPAEKCQLSMISITSLNDSLMRQNCSYNVDYLSGGSAWLGVITVVVAIPQK